MHGPAKNEPAERLGLSVYFCKMHAPWLKGAVENANGHLRVFLPKGKPLDGRTQTNLDDVHNPMNGLPRRVLGGISARESFPGPLPKPSNGTIFTLPFGTPTEFVLAMGGHKRIAEVP